jgi:small-conductance mechanosensitive channel
MSHTLQNLCKTKTDTYIPSLQKSSVIADLFRYPLIVATIILFATFSANAQQVTSSADAGAGSLRAVIASASSGATITFAAGVTSITLTSGEILIDKNLTINGGSGSTRVTISGNNNSMIFD